jgi:hypothetical protein
MNIGEIGTLIHAVLPRFSRRAMVVTLDFLWQA